MSSDASPNLELRSWLALLRAPGIGSKRFALILERFGSARACLDAKPPDWVAAGIPDRALESLSAPDWERIDSDLRWAGEPGNFCIDWEHPRYPTLLREIADAPPVLFVRGDPTVLSVSQLAIVGSRNPSPAGRQTAERFAFELAAQGLAITSGLAIGIDAAAHRGALEAQGLTIGVAGTGPDLVYPTQHRELNDRILANGGAVVSEFPPGTRASASNFPRRNRIISGLARGTLVVEAAAQSGSLITARQALEQNRDVFAVPGSIYSPLSLGCNALIKEGAKLVQSVADIVEDLRFLPAPPGRSDAPAVATSADETSLSLLKFVAYDPTSVDTLVAATGKTPEFIASMLVLLELQGLVASVPGGCYVRLR